MTLRPLLCAALAALLAACANDPPAPALPQSAWPTRFSQAGVEWTVVPPAEALPRGPWWTAFGDAQLNRLAEQAGQRNTDIALAAARVAQARALLAGAAAQARPQVGLSVGANRQGGPLLNAAGSSGTLLTAGVGASYEADFFGRAAATQDAAALDLRARQALLNSTRLLVQAEVAQAYFRLRALQAEEALATRSVQAWQETLRLTEARQRSGSLAEAAVLRVRAELATAQAERLALQRRGAEQDHALALLLGEPASAFSLPPAAAGALPERWLPVPAGLPAAMLARRPDVAAAQQALLAAQARLGVAQRAWFPSLLLTASGGQASPDLGTLLQASMRAWGVGALLALPLFDGGRREAAKQQAQAEVEAALAQHRAQILGAFKDVEDQLVALRLLAAEHAQQASAVDSAARATALLQSRRQNGGVSDFDVLQAQRDEWRSRRALLQLHAARGQATVALIRALGGGWGDAAAAPLAQAVDQNAAAPGTGS